jgi:hypothetical protein
MSLSGQLNILRVLLGGNHRRGKRAVTQSILQQAFSRFTF